MRTKFANLTTLPAVVALAIFDLQLATAHAQGTALTYQGRQTDDRSLVNGSAGFRLGQNGQCFAPAGQENLRSVRGVVRHDVALFAGYGLVVVHNTTGSYTLTFSPPFCAMPAITATIRHGIVQTVTCSNASANSADIDTWDANGAASDPCFILLPSGRNNAPARVLEK